MRYFYSRGLGLGFVSHTEPSLEGEPQEPLQEKL